MKKAIRISPVMIGSTLYSSVVFGDESKLIPFAEWPDLDAPVAFTTHDGVLMECSPWLASRLVLSDILPLNADASAEIHSDKDCYFITWTDPDVEDK